MSRVLEFPESARQQRARTAEVPKAEKPTIVPRGVWIDMVMRDGQMVLIAVDSRGRLLGEIVLYEEVRPLAKRVLTELLDTVDRLGPKPVLHPR